MGSLIRFPFFKAVKGSGVSDEMYGRSRVLTEDTSGAAVLVLTNRPETFINGRAVFRMLGLEAAYTSFFDLALEMLVESPNSWSAVVIRLNDEFRTPNLKDFVKKAKLINASIPVIVMTDEIGAAEGGWGVSEYGDGLFSENLDRFRLFKELVAGIEVQAETR